MPLFVHYVLMHQSDATKHEATKQTPHRKVKRASKREREKKRVSHTPSALCIVAAVRVSGEYASQEVFHRLDDAPMQLAPIGIQQSTLVHPSHCISKTNSSKFHFNFFFSPRTMYEMNKKRTFRFFSAYLNCGFKKKIFKNWEN